MEQPMPVATVSIVIAAVLGLLAGGALARSNLCMMRAAHDLSHGRFQAVAGLLAVSAIGALVLFATEQAGWHKPAPWTWPTAMTLVGAVTFAIGARLNAACSIGTVGRLASGDLGALATIGGLLAAVALLPRTMIMDQKPAWAGSVQLPLVGAMALLIVVFILIAWWRGGVRHLGPPLLLGAFAALLYSLQTHVTWLELATEALHGTGTYVAAGVGFLALLAGAFAMRHWAGEIHWRLPQRARFIREAAGGFLMGVGSLMIPGTTDALAFYGVPSGSPHALVAFIVLFGTIVLSFRLFPPAASELPPFHTNKGSVKS